MTDPAEPTQARSASAASTFLEKYRLILSKVFVASIVALLLFSASRWELAPLSAWLLDSLGLILLLVACLGRVWCTMYLGGYKNSKVVTAGPYSMVRNPLYVFSFIGAIGLGLLSHSLLITALLLVFFIGIYPFVIAKEEANLHGLFGDDYEQYCAKTPRLMPSLKLFSKSSQLPVDSKRLEWSFFDSGAFVLAFIALTGIRLAHESGVLPVLFYVP